MEALKSKFSPFQNKYAIFKPSLNSVEATKLKKVSEKEEIVQEKLVEKFQTINSSLHQEAEKIRLWKNTTEHEMTVKQVKLDESIVTIDNLKKSNSSLILELETIKHKFNETIKYKSEINEQISLTRNICDIFKVKIEKLEKSIMLGDNDLKELIAYDQQKQNDLNVVINKFNNLNTQYIETSNIFDQKIAELTKENVENIDKYQTEIEILNKSIINLQNELKSSVDKIFQLESCDTDNRTYIDYLMNQTNFVNTFYNQSLSYLVEFDALLSQSIIHNVQIFNKNREFQLELDEFKNKYSDLEIQLQMQISINLHLKLENEINIESCLNLKKIIIELEKSRDNYMMENDEYKTSIMILMNSFNDSFFFMKDLLNTDKLSNLKLIDSENKFNSLEENFKMISQSNQELITNYEKLNMELLTKNNLISYLQSEINNFSEKLDNMKSDIFKQSCDISKLTDEAALKTKDIKTLEDENKLLREKDLNNLRKLELNEELVKDLTNKLTIEKSNIDEIKMIKNEIENTFAKELLKKNDELNMVRKDNEELKLKISKMSSENEKLQENLTNFRNELMISTKNRDNGINQEFNKSPKTPSLGNSNFDKINKKRFVASTPSIERNVVSTLTKKTPKLHETKMISRSKLHIKNKHKQNLKNSFENGNAEMNWFESNDVFGYQMEL